MILRRLRTEDDGFSLIELLTAMVIGGVVLAALMSVVQRAVSSTTQTSDRVEALQRGRQAMDRVTTLLNSQLCLVKKSDTTTTGTPPIIVGDVNQIAFYATLGTVDTVPTLYRLTYNPATKRLTEDRYAPNTQGPDPTYPGYPNAPNVSRVIGTNIVPDNNKSTGLFSYYQFITTEGPTLGRVDEVNPLTTPLNDAGKAAAVRVKVAFATQPTHTGGSAIDVRGTRLEGIGLVGSANPGEPTKGVNC
jgi:prepilin-type N-terminal cleavage/methylation domain-containing protein